MGKCYIENKTYNKIDFNVESLIEGEYEGCNFINCDFSNINLFYFAFIDCEFVSCNLSLVKLSDTAFRDCNFKDSKMVGINFSSCNKFGLSFHFENCILNLSSFYQINIKQTKFKKSQLHEVDFTECDLTSSVFDDCDLWSAIFFRTKIEKTDFRTAFNYTIDPENNKIKKAKFSLNGVKGLLNKYDIDIIN